MEFAAGFGRWAGQVLRMKIGNYIQDCKVRKRRLVIDPNAGEAPDQSSPEGKYDLDTPGHYARPDVFQLHVNLRKQNIVTTWDAELKDPFEG